jgi:hypothetical protein
VEEITFELDDPEILAHDPEVADGTVLPLIGGTGPGRRLYTRNALLQAGEPVVALRLPAPLADPGRSLAREAT